MHELPAAPGLYAIAGFICLALSVIVLACCLTTAIRAALARRRTRSPQ